MDKTILNILNDLKINRKTFLQYDNENAIYVHNQNTIHCYDFITYRDLCFNLFCHSESATMILNKHIDKWIFTDELGNTINVVLKKKRCK